VKLSKWSFLPPLLDLYYSNSIDACFFVFIKSLFIRDEKEGFNGEVNDVPLTANTVVDRIVVKSKITS